METESSAASLSQPSVIVHAGSSTSSVPPLANIPNSEDEEEEEEEGELKDEEELTKQAESIIQAPVSQDGAGPSTSDPVERWVIIDE